MPDNLPVQPSVPEGEDKVALAAGKTLSESVISETEPFHLSFEEYNEKECLVDVMNKENARMALKLLRNVGVNFTDQSHFLLSCPANTRIAHVNNSGGYTSLFRGMRDEFKDRIDEIVYDEKAKDIEVRIFFTTLVPQRIFYVIAIRGSGHYDTDKSNKKSPRDFREQIQKRRRFR